MWEGSLYTIGAVLALETVSLAAPPTKKVVARLQRVRLYDLMEYFVVGNGQPWHLHCKVVIYKVVTYEINLCLSLAPRDRNRGDIKEGFGRYEQA